MPKISTPCELQREFKTTHSVQNNALDGTVLTVYLHDDSVKKPDTRKTFKK